MSLEMQGRLLGKYQDQIHELELNEKKLRDRIAYLEEGGVGGAVKLTAFSKLPAYWKVKYAGNPRMSKYTEQCARDVESILSGGAVITNVSGSLQPVMAYMSGFVGASASEEMKDEDV